MKPIRAWISRLAGMLPNARRERELADEIEGHLQMHIDDNLRAGMTPEQSRRDAILKLGGVESTKQVYRERSTIPFLENLLQDVRFAIRQLRKSPGFTCTAILMLALGMCASVSIFAFVDAALIKPLPYRNPERLVGVFERVPLFPQSSLSYPDYIDWKKLNKVFQSMLGRPWHGEHNEVPERDVSSGYFTTLGVKLLRGRYFADAEDISKPRVAILIRRWRDNTSLVKILSASSSRTFRFRPSQSKSSASWKISKKARWI